jgi:transcriptional regulator with XRE-family HTH domain
MGTTQSAIARAEIDASQPSIAFLRRVAKATGQPITIRIEPPQPIARDKALNRWRMVGGGEFDPLSRGPEPAELRQLSREKAGAGHLEQSFSLEDPPVRAWSWDQYEAWLMPRWTALLASNPNERTVQHFLEAHPCLVPGTGSEGAVGLHHGPIMHVVVTQPPLRGLINRRPDFMWITKHSGALMPVLVELEAPGKRWFTKRGIPTRFVSQALYQVSEWRHWLSYHRNQFLDLYHIPEDLRDSAFAPGFCVVMGRRKEFSDRPGLAAVRHHMQPPETSLMTYDRLRPDVLASNSVTVRVTAANKLTVVAVPPTMTMGPGWAETLQYLPDLERAVARSELIPPERKAFLESRVAYWRAWGRERRSYLIDAFDERE